MPELPEVETVSRTLRPLLTGRTIDYVEIGNFTRFIATPDPASFRNRLLGRTFAGTGRRGKYILLDLDNADRMTIHLRMTGELWIASPQEPDRIHQHLKIGLNDGSELRYSDTRKFGRINLLTPDEYNLLDRKLGPEPLDPEFSAEMFHGMLATRRRAIKTLLLEQTFLVGVGNIYADEALFAARIHPVRPASSLTLNEVARLLAAIQAVLHSAIERRGTTLRDYRDGSGLMGENQGYLTIYHRESGEPCPECGGPVERLVVGQRGTKLCPACQPIDSAV